MYHNFKNILFLISLMITGMFSANKAEAQLFEDVSFDLGYTSLQILGSNINREELMPYNSPKVFQIGGGYNASQSGIQMRVNFKLDDRNRFEIPVGFDYHFFTSKELLQALTYKTRAENSVHIPSFSVGLNYTILYMPPANAKFYVGAEARASYITNQEAHYSTVGIRVAGQPVSMIDDVHHYYTKEDALRFGGLIHLGMSGELEAPIYINARFSVGALNFLGRDGERGELLTPIKRQIENGITEVSEAIIPVFQFTLSVQYKF
jgi:hypothetical protein